MKFDTAVFAKSNSIREKSQKSNGKQLRLPIEGKLIKKDQKRRKVIEVVSLFSGAGGFDLGLIGGFNYRERRYSKNKFRITFANDIDPACELVYNKNRNYFKHKLYLDNIVNIPDSEISNFEFLIAGFPCQPFSNAGLRKGINDERGSLFEQAIRFLKVGGSKKEKPLGFIFENVRGIMSSKMPDGTTVPDEIVKRTEKLGYKTNYKLIRASDYGVPSDRYRLFVVGIRDDYDYFDFNLLDEIVFKYDIPSRQTDPYELYLGSVLSDISPGASQNDEYWKLSPAGQKMIEKIGVCEDGIETLEKFRNKVPISDISPTITNGRSWKNMKYRDMTKRFKTIWDNPKKYRAPNFYRRYALGEINGTIIASGQPENSGITHPFYNRRFTIREIARIQSFPDDFEFPYTTISNAYKVIGNAVPPVLAWVFAKALEKIYY